jgi:hypothetical protein
MVANIKSMTASFFLNDPPSSLHSMPLIFKHWELLSEEKTFKNINALFHWTQTWEGPGRLMRAPYVFFCNYIVLSKDWTLFTLLYPNLVWGEQFWWGTFFSVILLWCSLLCFTELIWSLLKFGEKIHYLGPTTSKMLDSGVSKLWLIVHTETTDIRCL